MTSGQLAYAKRKALELFDAWNDVTGAVEKFSGWYHELEAVVEDAVDVGAMMASGVAFIIKNGELVKIAAGPAQTVEMAPEDSTDDGQHAVPISQDLDTNVAPDRHLYFMFSYTCPDGNKISAGLAVLQNHWADAIIRCASKANMVLEIKTQFLARGWTESAFCAGDIRYCRDSRPAIRVSEPTASAPSSSIRAVRSAIRSLVDDAKVLHFEFSYQCSDGTVLTSHLNIAERAWRNRKKCRRAKDEVIHQLQEAYERGYHSEPFRRQNVRYTRDWS